MAGIYNVNDGGKRKHNYWLGKVRNFELHKEQIRKFHAFRCVQRFTPTWKCGNYRVSISVFTTSSWPGVLQAEADRNCIAENEEAESDWEERVEEGNAFDAFNKM